MFYLFSGDDRFKLKDKCNLLIEAAQKKRPNSNVLKIDDYEDVDSIEVSLKTRGLFDDKSIVFVDTTESDMLFDYVVKRKDVISSSENLFIIYIGNAKASDLKKLKDFSYKSEEMKLEKEKFFDGKVFSITNSFLNKDSESCWKKYVEFLVEGISPEEIHGVLFWQVKVLDLVKNLNEKDSSLKPFVYAKNKKFVDSFSNEEIQKHLLDLTNVWDVSHGKGGNLETSLERYLLKI